MFVFANKGELHPLLPFGFALTNVLLGFVGFLLAYRHVKRAHYYSAHTLWVRSYSIMFGILGFGYRRFLYAGTGAEWVADKKYLAADFFHSDVFCTLCAMGVIVIPLLIVPQIKWSVSLSHSLFPALRFPPSRTLSTSLGSTPLATPTITRSTSGAT